MKNLLLLTLATITFLSCSDDELTISDLNGSGIWVEKVSYVAFQDTINSRNDTIEFRIDQTIGIHPFYEGYGYKFQNEELILIRPSDSNKRSVKVEIQSNKEIRLNGFHISLAVDVVTTELIKL